MIYPCIIECVAGFLNHGPCWCAHLLQANRSDDLFCPAVTSHHLYLQMFTQHLIQIPNRLTLMVYPYISYMYCVSQKKRARKATDKYVAVW